METLVLIIAFWLILVGIYGALPMMRAPFQNRRPQPPRYAGPAVDDYDDIPHAVSEPLPVIQTVSRQPEARKQRKGVVVAPSATASAVFSEVDMLRAQVEHLRSEITTLSVPDRSQRKPAATAAAAAPARRRARHADLPRDLRRQVKEARTTGRPMHA